MSTYNQLVRRGRKARKRGKKRSGLGQPQVLGTVIRVFHLSPKKPNSANRWAAKLRLKDGSEVTASVPGEGNGMLMVHNHVLIRGGRVKDLPGIRLRIVRGALDSKSVKDRLTARSRYGTKKPSEEEALKLSMRKQGR